MASIYAPLRKHLDGVTADSAVLTWREIQTILGFALPKSARFRPQWWASDVVPDTRHSHAKEGWLLSGWKAKPDFTKQLTTFTKTR
jgi:hypothetical protein